MAHDRPVLRGQLCATATDDRVDGGVPPAGALLTELAADEWRAATDCSRRDVREMVATWWARGRPATLRDLGRISLSRAAHRGAGVDGMHVVQG